MGATPFNSVKSKPTCRSTPLSSFRRRRPPGAVNEFGFRTVRTVAEGFVCGHKFDMMTGKGAGLMWITIERIVLAGLVAVPLWGQGSAYRAPRAEGGKPDLNGVWQVLNEANYDLEGHSARPAMALRPGPYGPVPAA